MNSASGVKGRVKAIESAEAPVVDPVVNSDSSSTVNDHVTSDSSYQPPRITREVFGAFANTAVTPIPVD